jgi:hypothetical protein
MAHLGGGERLSITGDALDDAAVEALSAAARFIGTIRHVSLPSASEAQKAAIVARIPQAKFAAPRNVERYTPRELDDDFN